MSKSKFGNTASVMENSGTHASTYLDFIQSRRGIRNASDRQPKDLFLATDEKMLRVQDIVWQVADTNVPVLISGEDGVGKTVIANSIHEAATDSGKKIITLDCKGVPKQLLESELFGSEKVNANGEREVQKGLIEQVGDGTLIIDEIGELDTSAQTGLLRVLREKTIERVGGTASIPVNARVVATTSSDLLARISNGTFRQDLYYRLYVIHLEIPPLRERPKDIESLGNHFLGKWGASFGKNGLTFAQESIEKLKSYTWPDNVRELESVIQKAVVMASGDLITPACIPIEGEKQVMSLDWVGALPVGETLRTVETHFILETLKSHNGNRTHAAKTLGISLRTLRNKINEFTTMGYEVMPPQTGRSL